MEIDWGECAAVEVVPGRLSGAPTIRNSRVRPEDLLINREQGLDWLARNHGIAPETIREVFAFYDAHKHRRRAPARM